MAQELCSARGERGTELRSGAIPAYPMERGCVWCVQGERRFSVEMYYTVSVRCWTWRCMKANREISGIRKEEKKKRRQGKRVNGRSIKGRVGSGSKSEAVGTDVRCVKSQHLLLEISCLHETLYPFRRGPCKSYRL